MTELKPCPFCGGEVSIADMGRYWMVTRASGMKTTKMCHCRVFMESELFHDEDSKQRAKEKLIERWNTRPNPWHTGTPTEEGWYLVWMGKINGNIYERPAVMLFENGDWASRLVANTYVAYQKIEPYKENEDGHTD